MKTTAFFFSLLLFLTRVCLPAPAFAQTAARTYSTSSDRAGAVSVFGFYNPSDQKTYVLNGDPASFALPVTGTFTTTAGPVRYVRNGVDTEALVDTVTPANNRPLPFSLFTGDSGNPVQFGVGASNSSTLRVHVGNGADIPVSVNNSPTVINADSVGTAITGTNQSGSKRSLDVSAFQSGTWNVGVTSSALPTGAATETTLSTIDGKLPSLVSGRIPVDGSGVTQPISAASLPLPTGAATEATLSSLNGKVTAVDTGNVTVVSSALPTGAATAANQTTANTSLSSIDAKAVQQALDFGASSGGVRTAAQIGNASGAADFGAGAAGAQTLRVVAANEANPRKGKSVIFTSSTDLSSSPLGTTYLQLSASLSAAVSECAVFWPDAQPLRFATGAAASEVVLVNVPPGGTDRIPVTIAAGTRVAVRAEASTVSSGYLTVTCYGD